jgi:hypothetical protein
MRNIVAQSGAAAAENAAGLPSRFAGYLGGGPVAAVIKSPSPAAMILLSACGVRGIG